MHKSGEASHQLGTVSEDSFVFSHCPLLCYQEQLWSQHLWQIRVIWLELTFPIVLCLQVEKVAYLCTLQGSSELYKSSPAMRSSGLWENSNAHYDSQSPVIWRMWWHASHDLLLYPCEYGLHRRDSEGLNIWVSSNTGWTCEGSWVQFQTSVSKTKQQHWPFNPPEAFGFFTSCD